MIEPDLRQGICSESTRLLMVSFVCVDRGDANQIAIYAIGKDGKLSIVGHQSVLGKTPRNFAIDPTGNFLLAANQNTNDIVIFKRDHKTGMLTSTGKKISVDKPVCLKFVEIEK